MKAFRYAAPASAAEALAAAASERGARFVAGGTNLLDLMKHAVEDPPLLVDINGTDLRGIEVRGETLVVGALERMSDVARHPVVRDRLPLVAGALEESASPQLRNMATMAGNVLQRTRCPYFRDVATPCNKRDPGSGCGAIGGVNRRQAVLGTSDRCIATHPSDLAVALVAIDARVVVAGGDGEREIAMRDFYALPGETPHVENALRAGELVTALHLPILPYAWRSAYVKARDRAQFDFALASAAVALDLENGRIRNARIALGGVATVPWHVPDAERELAGGPPDRDRFVAAAETAMRGARGYGENDFKILLGKRVLVRALEVAASIPDRG